MLLMVEAPSLKPVIWVSSSRKDLREFPGPVQDHIGYAQYVAYSSTIHVAKEKPDEHETDQSPV